MNAKVELGEALVTNFEFDVGFGDLDDGMQMVMVKLTEPGLEGICYGVKAAGAREIATAMLQAADVIDGNIARPGGAN